MSRSVKALNGFAADIIGQIVTQLLTFVAIPIYLTYLNDTSYGYWLTIGSIIMWISLSDFGIGMALGRLLIKVQSTATGDRLEADRNSLINTSIVIFIGCALVFFLSGLVLYPFCLKWFKISQATQHTFTITYFICIVAGSLSLPSSVFGGILESNQKLALNRNLNTFGTVLNVLLSIVLIYFFKNITALSYALLISVLVRTAVSWYYANGTTKIKLNFFDYNKGYAKQLLSSGGYFQIARIANTVATNSDNLFISSFLNANIVPMYSFTTKMAQVFGITLASKIPNVLFAGMAEIIDLNQIERLQIVFQLLLKILLRLAVLTCAFAFFFNENFVTLWVGKHNYAGQWVNIVVCYWIFYEFIARGTATLVFAFGDFKGYAYVSVLEIIGNVVLSIILIQKMGLLGVALATAISRTLTSGMYLFIYFKKKRLLNVNLLFILLKVLLKSIPCIIFYFICKSIVHHVTWVDLVVIGAAGSIINLISFDIVVIIKNRKLGVKALFQKILSTV
jgi:O-antigen/teichoic acid export membrane protein